MDETAVENKISIMFGFFINQFNIDDKKLYQKVIDLCKKQIRLERSKKCVEVCIKQPF